MFQNDSYSSTWYRSNSSTNWGEWKKVGYEEKPKLLAASEFFESTNIPIKGCYIYKIGNLINIQRLFFDSQTLTLPTSGNGEFKVGVIKDKYKPICNQTVRISYQLDKVITTPQLGYIKGNGTISLIFNQSSITGGYIYNTAYICKNT